MKKNNRKESVINGKNVLRTVVLASSCLAVAAMLVPATPVIGGIGFVLRQSHLGCEDTHSFNALIFALLLYGQCLCRSMQKMVSELCDILKNL